MRFRFCFASLCALCPVLATAELSIEGVDSQLRDNVFAFVALADEPCTAESWLVERRFKAAPDEARKALEPYGYYNPTIESSLEFHPQCWQASLTIDAGAPVRLRTVDLEISGEATGDDAFQAVLKPTALTSGQTLQHRAYAGLKKNLQIVAADRGYLDAKFTSSKIDVWPEELVADVQLHLDSGPRYRIGAVSIDQTILNDDLVQRYFDLEPGALFDVEVLAKAQSDLSESAYFQSADVIADRDGATEDTIPINIVLSPAPRIEYTLGAGASTDNGPRLRAGYRQNRINRAGHRLVSDLEASSAVNGLSAEYRIPLADPRREWFSIAGALASERVDSFDNESQRLGVRWTRALSDTWLRTVSLDVNNESFNVANEASTVFTVVPTIAFDHKRADREVFPGQGYRLGLALSGTDQALGSDTAYVQLSVRARSIHSLGENTRILTLLNIGTSWADEFSDLPPSVRFFAGGDESIRGFGYQSLGPKDDNDEVIGGTHLLVASIELERRLRGNFYGALFVDAGNAFNDNQFDAEVGAGIGLKWRSPLGPIRLYLGYPVSDKDENVRLHLRLGAEL